MVSTRGVKLKFSEGERVLCYEPDPTKAKVLYDSKVLDVIVNKDLKGRKSVEYLIHFQGWNSSWDRCVNDEFVLKDTPENRQLQRDLAQKSQLQLGAYLYRKEKKKHSRKTHDNAAGQSSEDGSSGSPARMDTDDATSSSNDDSSTEEDFVPIELTPNLKQILENDYYMINSKNMLHNLPAKHCVAIILEMYFKHFYNNQMINHEKNGSRYRNHHHNMKVTLEDIHKNLVVCREFLDGVRLYFDSTLNDLLLYRQEKNVFQTAIAVYPSIVDMDKMTTSVSQTNASGDQENGMQDCTEGVLRKRSLRSYTNQESNGNSHNDSISYNNGSKTCPSIASSNSEISTVPPLSMRSISWRSLPDFVYNQQPPPPCLVYGATHLTRLMIKMPELLRSSDITDENLKKLLKHLDLFIDYINEHNEWFGEKCYRAV